MGITSDDKADIMKTFCFPFIITLVSALQWHHNEHYGVSNHQPHDRLFNRLFRRRSKRTSKLRVTGLCERNSPVTGEFPAQRASNAENVFSWWRHYDDITCWSPRSTIHAPSCPTLCDCQQWNLWSGDSIKFSTGYLILLWWGIHSTIPVAPVPLSTESYSECAS